MAGFPQTRLTLPRLIAPGILSIGGAGTSSPEVSLCNRAVLRTGRAGLLTGVLAAATTSFELAGVSGGLVSLDSILFVGSANLETRFNVIAFTASVGLRH